MSQTPALPHKIAVLVYVYDDVGALLLLHRKKAPNAGFYSPIGGKLHADEGESPHQCAVREVLEEIGVELGDSELHLMGLVTERGYENETHWMMFLFEVTRPMAHAELAWAEFPEGKLEWIPVDQVASLKIPDTDRLVMWPLVQQHRGGGFFVAHIDCGGSVGLSWTLHASTPAAALPQ